jgi:hypothetical protein
MLRLSQLLVVSAFALAVSTGHGYADQKDRPAPSIAKLAWLAGNWIEVRNDSTVRERWTGPYGGMLLGIGVTERANGKHAFEFMRISETATGFSFFASPNAAAPTEFKAIEATAAKVVFENKDHDFPQRVIYAKNADGTLTARIEGTLNGKPAGETWHYKPER